VLLLSGVINQMNKILKTYINRSVVDIYAVGRIDLGECNLEVFINELYVYIQFEEDILMVYHDNDADELLVKKLGTILFDFKIDENESHVKLQISTLFLLDTISDIKLDEILVYYVDGKSRAIELVLKNKQTLFFDSTFYTGIKIGENQVKEYFFLNNENRDVTKKSIK